jgi:hypothetical protein
MRSTSKTTNKLFLFSSEQRWALNASLLFPIHFWFHSSKSQQCLQLSVTFLIQLLLNIGSKRLSLSRSLSQFFDKRCKFTIFGREAQIVSSALCCLFFYLYIMRFFPFSFRFQFTSRRDSLFVLFLSCIRSWEDAFPSWSVNHLFASK